MGMSERPTQMELDIAEQKEWADAEYRRQYEIAIAVLGKAMIKEAIDACIRNDTPELREQYKRGTIGHSLAWWL